ncbi:MAG TPA: hypothetical protein VMH34_07520 [Gammaproteobacteria bacterium]|nr:hypothetical protein [Gammaproteobacteria bacterium]
MSILLACPVALPVYVMAQAPTDEELKALEQQIEKKEAEQAEAKKKAEAEAKKKAEAERKKKEEEAAQQRAAEEEKKKQEEASKQAAEEAQRKAEEEKHRQQLEQQQRVEFDREMRDGDAAMNKKDYAPALQAYTRALTFFPNDATALAGQARAKEFQETCSALVGEWDWVLGSTTIVNADGTLQNLSLIPNQGNWECTDPSQRKFTLHWVIGGWVDTITLSEDRNTVDAINNIGVRFQGFRKGTQKKPPPRNPLYGP